MDFVKKLLYFFLNLTSSGMVGVLSYFVYLFGFDAGFFMSFIYAMITGAITFFGINYFLRWRDQQGSRLSFKEYKYIHSHLREGKAKIRRIEKNIFRLGGFSQLMKNYAVIKTIRKIHSIVSKDPIRFYEAEIFYYTHLDSMAELTERYVFLDSQPVKTMEIMDSLKETKRTIGEMAKTIDDDLRQLLERDVRALRLELDVAKKSIETSQALQENKETENKVE